MRRRPMASCDSDSRPCATRAHGHLRHRYFMAVHAARVLAQDARRCPTAAQSRQKPVPGRDRVARPGSRCGASPRPYATQAHGHVRRGPMATSGTDTWQRYMATCNADPQCCTDPCHDHVRRRPMTKCDIAPWPPNHHAGPRPPYHDHRSPPGAAISAAPSAPRERQAEGAGCDQVTVFRTRMEKGVPAPTPEPLSPPRAPQCHRARNRMDLAFWPC